MANLISISSSDIARLLSQPSKTIIAYAGKISFKLKIAIPNYLENISNYYSDIVQGNLAKLANKIKIPTGFQHYGLICTFEQPTELHIHDISMTLNNSLREMIRVFGAVIIKNAYMDYQCRSIGHKNRFAHLSFHVDRNPNQGTVYSVYSRNPFDKEQKAPRTSSTLFSSNIVGYLQSVRVGRSDVNKDQGCRAPYNDVFNDEEISEQIDKIILEHKWDEPEGTGEISMLDNRKALHASYYNNPIAKSYRIGVRYVK